MKKNQDPQDLIIWLKKNGELMQRDSTKNMIIKIPEIIESISSVFTLEESKLTLY
jgi:acylpyruvate hydrolase